MTHYHPIWEAPGPADLKAGVAAVEKAKEWNCPYWQDQRARIWPRVADLQYRVRHDSERIRSNTGGVKMSALEAYEASAARSDFYRAVSTLFEKYEYLLLPSAQVFPFDAGLHWPKTINGMTMDTYHRWMEVVIPASLNGFPVINVPNGFSTEGLPMGLARG